MTIKDKNLRFRKNIKIRLDDILYVKSEINYCQIYLKSSSQPILRAQTLKSVSELLEAYGFWRCNKSYLVNLKYAKVRAQESTLKLPGHLPLPISRRKLKQYLLEKEEG